MVGLVAVSLALLVGYGVHARRTEFPLLNLDLFRIRTFCTAVSGSFFTRLGIGGVPFLLPLLYQEGLGLKPVQSGLLIMPQALAALSTKTILPKLLERLGYRNILIGNTVILGVLLMAFATIGSRTPYWLIVVQALAYGVFHLDPIYQHEHTGLRRRPQDPGQRASSIASTCQQLSASFGVAAAGLTTLFFLPKTVDAPGMISGLHQAFLVLGVFTVVSTPAVRPPEA